MSPPFSVVVQYHKEKSLVFEKMLYLQSTVKAAKRLFYDFVPSEFDCSINSSTDSFN